MTKGSPDDDYGLFGGVVHDQRGRCAHNKAPTVILNSNGVQIASQVEEDDEKETSISFIGL